MKPAYNVRDEQRSICEKYGSKFLLPLERDKIGIALATLHLEPIYGVRVLPTEGVAGWYIWGGPHSKDPDFFQPLHVVHLNEKCPSVIKYLALEAGYKFIADSAGFEDVWQEKDGEPGNLEG